MSELEGAGYFGGRGNNRKSSRLNSMEIVNLERNWNSQRQKELNENRCFQSHKVGCRPWKHKKYKGIISNQKKMGMAMIKTQVKQETAKSDSDSEN